MAGRSERWATAIETHQDEIEEKRLSDMSKEIFELRIAFLGTFHPAVYTFCELAERGLVCVAVLPEEAGYKNDQLLQSINEFAVPWSYNIEEIDQYSPNFLLAANYPKIVPSRYLSAFPCINTHWSLLPRWRGVHPTAWAVINGDEKVGLTVHMMEKEFDVGGILAQCSIDIKPEMDLNGIHELLAQEQAICVIRVIEEYMETGRFAIIDQNETLATYVPQRRPEDGIIHWDWPTSRIAGLVKALPLPKYPGAFTHLGTRKLVIAKAKAAECPTYFSTPGQVVRVLKNGSVWIKTGDTCLEAQEVLLEEEGVIKVAAEKLKRGVKLGYDPQLEIAALTQKIDLLQTQMDQIVDLIKG